VRFEQNFSAIKLDLFRVELAILFCAPFCSDGQWALLTDMMSDVPVFYDCVNLPAFSVPPS
jgi:hypothetical protein